MEVGEGKANRRICSEASIWSEHFDHGRLVWVLDREVDFTMVEAVLIGAVRETKDNVMPLKYVF